jgi:hypothetical protein
LLKNSLTFSAIWKRSPEMFICVSFCSRVNIRGTKCWQKRSRTPGTFWSYDV